MPARKKKPAAKGGRPAKYSARWTPIAAEFMANTGMIDKDMAEAFGISESTFHKWKKDHAEFKRALAKGKQGPDDKVEKALYERALGYSHPEDKIMQYEGIPVIVPTTKHYPPEVMACIYWLNNRRPDKWKQKQEILNTFDSSAKELADAIRNIK